MEISGKLSGILSAKLVLTMLIFAGLSLIPATAYTPLEDTEGYIMMLSTDADGRTSPVDANISYIAANGANEYINISVDVELNGEVIDSRDISLRPGGTEVVSFQHTIEQPDDYVLTAGEQTEEFTVESGGEPDIQLVDYNAELEDDEIPGEIFIEYMVENLGDAHGEETVTVEVNDETVVREIHSLDPSEVETVTTDYRYTEPGEYEVSFNGNTEIIEVPEPEQPEAGALGEIIAEPTAVVSIGGLIVIGAVALAFVLNKVSSKKSVGNGKRKR